MAENIGLVFEMVDSDYVLVYRIIHIRNGIAITFFGNSHFFEITNGIIRNVTKQTVVDEFEIVFLRGKLTRKLLYYLWNISG